MKLQYPIFIAILFCTFFTTHFAFSQETDKVYLKSKKVIEGKVIQVTKNSVEMDPIGEIPFIMISRDSISVLIYSNNQVINFEGVSSNMNSRNLQKFGHDFKKEIYFETKYIGGWAMHDILFDDIVIDDKLNKNEIHLYISGYVHARNNDDNDIKSAVDIGYILLNVDAIYNNRKYSDKIEVDDGRTWSSGTGKYPGAYILNLGDYILNVTFDFVFLSSTTYWKGYRSQYTFNVNMHLETKD